MGGGPESHCIGRVYGADVAMISYKGLGKK